MRTSGAGNDRSTLDSHRVAPLPGIILEGIHPYNTHIGMLPVAAVCEVGRHYYFPTLLSNNWGLGGELTSGVQQG